jgi:hypothetical protein
MTIKLLLIVGCAGLALVAGCEKSDAQKPLRVDPLRTFVYVDSLRHVACYSQNKSLSCVPLDSTNSHAR